MPSARVVLFMVGSSLATFLQGCAPSPPSVTASAVTNTTHEAGAPASDVGEGVPRDNAEVVKSYVQAAAQGNALAQYNLGVSYEQGKRVPRNYAEAVKWFRQAAAQGFAPAQYNLGWMYHRGEGVPRDYAEAVKWYRQAAAQGYASAQLNLGAA
jgi:TPR repeat protein